MIAARLIWRMVSMDAHGIRIVIKKMRTISTTIIVARLRKRNVTLVWLDTVALMIIHMTKRRACANVNVSWSVMLVGYLLVGRSRQLSVMLVGYLLVGRRKQSV